MGCSGGAAPGAVTSQLVWDKATDYDCVGEPVRSTNNSAQLM